MIYFDNAATTFPKPQSVEQTLIRAVRKFGANPGRSGHDLSLRTAEQVYMCRESAAKMFGAENPEQVVFTQNCTHSTNIVIRGLLRPGDHVIISDMEHNAVLRPVHRLRESSVDYSIASPRNGESYPECYAREIRPNTRLIIATHGSNVFGTLLPIREIGAVAHAKNIPFLVDAAQSAGVVDIDIERDGIDYLCLPGHKGLYGPPGTGLLIFGKNALEKLPEPLITGGTGSMSLVYEQPDFLPDRFESGTVNTAGIIALGAGIEYVRRTGIGRLRSHEQKIMLQIYDYLARMPEAVLYTPRPEQPGYLPLLSFNLEGISGEKTAALLNNHGIATRGGFHCAALAHRSMGTLENGTCRISAGAFNTGDQAERVGYALKKIVKSM